MNPITVPVDEKRELYILLPFMGSILMRSKRRSLDLLQNF